MTNCHNRLQLLQDWTVSWPVPMPPINTGLVRGRDCPSKKAKAVPVWPGRPSIVTWKAKIGDLGGHGMKVIMASTDTCPSPIPAIAILDCPWQKLSTQRKFVTDSPVWWGKPLNVILTDDELGLDGGDSSSLIRLFIDSLIFVARVGVGKSVAIVITNTDITAKQDKTRVILWCCLEAKVYVGFFRLWYSHEIYRIYRKIIVLISIPIAFIPTELTGSFEGLPEILASVGETAANRGQSLFDRDKSGLLLKIGYWQTLASRITLSAFPIGSKFPEAINVSVCFRNLSILSAVWGVRVMVPELAPVSNNAANQQWHWSLAFSRRSLTCSTIPGTSSYLLRFDMAGSS